MRSIRLRLLAFAMAGVLVALAIAGAGLVALFGRHVERRAAQELDNTIAAIAGNIAFDPTGRLVLDREPGDPAYRTPLSGRYWQAGEVDAAVPLRSVSLWDQDLPLAAVPLDPGKTETARTLTEGNQQVIRRETTVVLAHKGRERRVRIAAALATAELDELRRGFARDLMPALLAFGLVVLVGAWLQVGAGLRPLGAVRAGLRGIRSGAAPRLDAAVPAEVAPLVEEINALLQQRDHEAEQARNRAADLAHGLKTPLTALLADAERLRQGGDARLAASISEGAAQMRRAVERELARARYRPSSAGRAPAGVAVRPVAEAVARTLSRTPAGETVAVAVDIPADAFAAVDPDDLHDLLGNLMENAMRAARSGVRVAATTDANGLSVAVADDGPGMPAERMRTLTARGARLDESGAGAGLGLAIVSDILAAYGSEPAFERAGSGGLIVRFLLPAASGSTGSARP